jgi:hypothetical protein
MANGYAKVSMQRLARAAARIDGRRKRSRARAYAHSTSAGYLCQHSIVPPAPKHVFSFLDMRSG